MLHLLSQDRPCPPTSEADGQRQRLLPPRSVPQGRLSPAPTDPTALSSPRHRSSCSLRRWRPPSYHPPPEPPDPPTSWPPPYARYARTVPHGLPMPFVEPPQGIVVGMLPPGQPQVRYLVPASRLQLSARAHTGHEAIQPHAQQCTRMVGWRSHRVTFYVDAKLRPCISIQSIDELGDEPRRMIQRQHPHLLSAHRSKRHLNISHLDVASNVHLTHTQRQPRLLRQAQ